MSTPGVQNLSNIFIFAKNLLKKGRKKRFEEQERKDLRYKESFCGDSIVSRVVMVKWLDDVWIEIPFFIEISFPLWIARRKCSMVWVYVGSHAETLSQGSFYDNLLLHNFFVFQNVAQIEYYR